MTAELHVGAHKQLNAITTASRPRVNRIAAMKAYANSGKHFFLQGVYGRWAWSAAFA